jgi:hypothetical protein
VTGGTTPPDYAAWRERAALLDRRRGAVFHPRLGVAGRGARTPGPLLGRATTLGAAFLALEAEKRASR